MSQWREAPLGQLCTEDRVTIDGQCDKAKSLRYVGLEHVVSGTGELISAHLGDNIDFGLSASFLFDERHVLYGKLRPYLNKVAAPNFRGRCSMELIPFLPEKGVDREFLAYAFRRQAVVNAAVAETNGSRMPRADLNVVLRVPTPFPPIPEQRRIVAQIESRRTVVAEIRSELLSQRADLAVLKEVLLHELFSADRFESVPLGGVLTQRTSGVGSAWASFPLYGATRDGIAPAKERVGKHGERYKPLDIGTIFYNPMRILLGSIAILEQPNPPGITSPDYVVFDTNRSVLDPTLFYEWFRGAYGQRMILDLARGAVRERILFPRLSQGTIPLPPIDEQRRVRSQLDNANRAIAQISAQLDDLRCLDNAVLAEAFA